MKAKRAPRRREIRQALADKPPLDVADSGRSVRIEYGNGTSYVYHGRLFKTRLRLSVAKAKREHRRITKQRIRSKHATKHVREKYGVGN